MTANSKPTLAELRREAVRVGFREESLIEARTRSGEDGDIFVDYIRVTGSSRIAARRYMLRLLQALPDGVMR